MSRKPVDFERWPDGLQVSYGPYRALIKHHVDGDTLDCLVDFGFNHYHYAAVRILGVNSPETNRPASREAGLAALAFVREVAPIGTPCVLVTLPDPDSFGRYLARVVFEDGRNLGTLIIQAGHGVPR